MLSPHCTQVAQQAAAAEELAAERQQVSQLQERLAAALAERDEQQVLV